MRTTALNGLVLAGAAFSIISMCLSLVRFPDACLVARFFVRERITPGCIIANKFLASTDSVVAWLPPVKKAAGIFCDRWEKQTDKRRTGVTMSRLLAIEEIAMRTASLLAALALPLAAASVAAAPVAQTWSYSFTGFQHVQSGAIDPALAVSGTFRGADLNADNTIDQSELTALTLHGFDFLACGTESYFTCQLDAFSFTPGSPLTLSAMWAAEDPDFTSQAGGSFTSGDRWRLFSNGTFGDRDDTWLFTSNTVERVSVVPEPSAIAMLAAGLAGMAGARGRRRRS